jgi:ABC-type glycerol-3-phosphate transport system substrate-binding protein
MARGEIVLHLNWPGVMTLLAEQGLVPDPIRSAPLPAGPLGRATVLGGGYIAIPRGARHRADAIRLARYLIGRDAQQHLVRDLGWSSPRSDVGPDEVNAASTGFAAMRPFVRSRPSRPDYPQLSRLWQRAFRAVAFEHARPEAALADAARVRAEIERRSSSP